MKAITVREKATGKMLACGPANGMYDPGFDPVLHTKQEEPDYDTLIAQHATDLAAAPNPRQTRLDALEAANTVSQLRAAVKDLLT